MSETFTLEIQGRKHETMYPIRSLEEAKRIAGDLIGGRGADLIAVVKNDRQVATLRTLINTVTGERTTQWLDY